MEAEYRSIYEKLKEFETQGRELGKQLNANKSPTIQEMEAYKKELLARFEENIDILQKMAEHSRSAHSRNLARIQLDYFQKMKQYFVRLDEDEEVEGHLLHSEFSIDLAEQSVIYALLSSLHSIEKSERKKMNERN